MTASSPTTSSSATTQQQAGAAAIPTLRVMRLQSPELYQSMSGSPATTTSTTATTAGNNNFNNTTTNNCFDCITNEMSLCTSLCLPDSLMVYVGETFTAYLGVLNSSSIVPIKKLTVSAQLQTPNQRYQLSTKQLQSPDGVDVPPSGIVDVIVSRSIEEIGQHILRIEVGYMTMDGGFKTFRKFYRFHVLQPFHITINEIVRYTDLQCYISASVSFNTADPTTAKTTANNKPESDKTTQQQQQQQQTTVQQPLLLISSATFEPASGLTARMIGPGTNIFKNNNPNINDESTDQQQSTNDRINNKKKTASQLLDAVTAGCINNNNNNNNTNHLTTNANTKSFQYLFVVEAMDEEMKLRGIVSGDLLGRMQFVWKKAMGETGIVYSPTLYCPRVEPTTSNHTNNAKANNNNFVVYQSGMTIDVASAAASLVRSGHTIGYNNNHSIQSLANQYPITIEPINPPTKLKLHIPQTIQFLIVNHTERSVTVQIQFRNNTTSSSSSSSSSTSTTSNNNNQQQQQNYRNCGLQVCGNSYINSNEIKPNGGSIVIHTRFLPIMPGIITLSGCYIVDLISGYEIQQPPLFHVFVEQ